MSPGIKIPTVISQAIHTLLVSPLYMDYPDIVLQNIHMISVEAFKLVNREDCQRFSTEFWNSRITVRCAFEKLSTNYNVEFHS